ncbi:hypothetical protein KP509_11G035000, partial [Ceratopteris richardii]
MRLGAYWLDKELARRCVRVLPAKYDGLVTTLNTQVRPNPLTFEEFSAMLLEEEMRLRNRQRISDAAFSANAKAAQACVDEPWILDSGASRHMTSKKDWYSSLVPLREPINVVVGNDPKCPAEGTGTISFITSQGVEKKLSDVLYVPTLKRNLLSVSAITNHGLEV